MEEVIVIISLGHKLTNTSGANCDATPISVVVFPLINASWEWVGMLPEHEVISSSKIKLLNGGGSGPDADSLPSLDDPDTEERDDRSSIGEKRTRFSLSHDDGSVGMLSFYASNNCGSLLLSS